MIAAIGTVLVWVIVGIAAVFGVLCATIGFLVLINMPTRFR